MKIQESFSEETLAKEFGPSWKTIERMKRWLVSYSDDSTLLSFATRDQLMLLKIARNSEPLTVPYPNEVPILDYDGRPVPIIARVYARISADVAAKISGREEMAATAAQTLALAVGVAVHGDVWDLPSASFRVTAAAEAVRCGGAWSDEGDAAYIAGLAVVVRDQIGQYEFTQEHYDTLMLPWISVFGDPFATLSDLPS